MTHYQVQFWVALEREWIYVKDFDVVAGQQIIRVDSAERLSLDQAKVRCERLANRHPRFTFKIAEVNY